MTNDADLPVERFLRERAQEHEALARWYTVRRWTNWLGCAAALGGCIGMFIHQGALVVIGYSLCAAMNLVGLFGTYRTERLLKRICRESIQP